MQGIHSFIRSICRFVLNISKKSYRNCAIITAGVCVVAVVAFSSRMFGGSGKNNGYGNAGLSVRTEQEAVDGTELDEANDVLDELQAGLEADEENLHADFGQNEAGKSVSLVAIGTGAALKEESLTSASVTDIAAEQELMPQIPDIDVSELETEADTVVDSSIGNDTEAFAEQDNVEAASFITTDGTPVTVTMRTPREVTDEEYNILLHIVAAEAGGCDIYGRILVANVIFNRVDDPRFPDTIEEVVFQKNQFSPATKGTIWKVKVTDKTREAVDRALAGEDYSCGAQFFSARKRLKEGAMSWFDSELERLYEHDGHEFFRYYD